MSNRPAPTTAFLIALLGGSGVLHFLRPDPFAAMVPEGWRYKRDLVYLSGGAELLGAAMMAAPTTRRLGGLFSAGVLVGVLPANVSMALGSGHRPPWYRALVWGRLPLQLPLIWWALRSGGRSPR